MAGNSKQQPNLLNPSLQGIRKQRRPPPHPHEPASMSNDGVQRFELVITATGVVKDKDGNVISNEPIEARAILTEDEVKAQIESMKEKP